jgi:hypothetical protein
MLFLQRGYMNCESTPVSRLAIALLAAAPEDDEKLTRETLELSVRDLLLLVSTLTVLGRRLVAGDRLEVLALCFQLS